MLNAVRGLGRNRIVGFATFLCERHPCSGGDHDAALWAAMQAGDVTAGSARLIRDIHGRATVQFHLEPTPRTASDAVLVDGERVATCRFEPEIGWYASARTMGERLSTEVRRPARNYLEDEAAMSTGRRKAKNTHSARPTRSTKCGSGCACSSRGTNAVQFRLETTPRCRCGPAGVEASASRRAASSPRSAGTASRGTRGERLS